MTDFSVAASMAAFDSALTNFIAQCHLLRPAWLLLLPVAVLLHLALRERHSVARIWRGIIAAHLLPHLTVNRSRHWRLEPRATLSLGLALSALALAGPAWEREPPPFVEDRAPLVIALDLGLTMNAIDIQPSRLIRAKQKIRDLLALRQGARTALIVYAGSAHVVLPMTDDGKILANYVDVVGSQIMPRAGKRTKTALQLAAQLLDKEPVPGSIVLITDGIDPEALEMAGTVSNNWPNLLIWGIGSKTGGPIPLSAANDTGSGAFAYSAERFALAADGSRQMARFDQEALAKFAASVNAGLIEQSVDGEDVAEVQRRIESRLVYAMGQAANTRWIDAGYWLLWPILLLAALSFRRGWTVRW